MYKMQQVLRTKVPMKTVDGTPVAPNTRVVVMKMIDEERVRVKVADPAHADLNKARVMSGVKAFNLTHRGRPKK